MRISIDLANDDDEAERPKLQSAAHLMNDDDDHDPLTGGGDDGSRPAPRKGAKVAGGKKGPVPPQFLKAMRARRKNK